MAAQIDKVTAQLRDMVMSGALKPGDRVLEVQFAARLGVSRTPLRIALGELEKEGLLERLPSRGFRVRVFSLDDIVDAVDVRGVLEGLAARIVAERGAPADLLAALDALVDEGARLLAPAMHRHDVSIDAHAWADMNRRFHSVLVEAAGNRALSSALDQNNKTPLSGPAALALPATPSSLDTPYLLQAQADHEAIVLAIRRGESSRAEALLREHAYKSRENKKLVLARIRESASLVKPEPARKRA